MYTTALFSVVTLFLSATLPVASAYQEDDFSLLRREAYLAGYAEGHVAGLSARDDDLDLHFAARDVFDDYDYSLWARGNIISSEKKAKIKAAEEEVDYCKRMLAEAIAEKRNGRIINDLKMKLMNAQGALAIAKKG